MHKIIICSSLWPKTASNTILNLSCQLWPQNLILIQFSHYIKICWQFDMFQNCSWFEIFFQPVYIFKIQLKCCYMGIQVSLEETDDKSWRWYKYLYTHAIVNYPYFPFFIKVPLTSIIFFLHKPSLMPCLLWQKKVFNPGFFLQMLYTFKAWKCGTSLAQGRQYRRMGLGYLVTSSQGFIPPRNKHKQGEIAKSIQFFLLLTLSGRWS